MFWAMSWKFLQSEQFSFAEAWCFIILKQSLKTRGHSTFSVWLLECWELSDMMDSELYEGAKPFKTLKTNNNSEVDRKPVEWG